MNRKRGVWLATMLLMLLVLPTLAACTIQMPTASEMGEEELALVEAEAAAKGLTTEQLLILAQLKDQGPAPELSNDVWLNTEGNSPLRLADLRGNVVIVEFWTYG